MNTIEKNLYDFYRIFASAKKSSHFSETDFEMIYSQGNLWPEMIFNLNRKKEPRVLIPKIASAMENKPVPQYFIANEDYISREHSGILKNNGILPVKILTGMDIVPAKNETILPPKCEIQNLADEVQLADFAHLIREEFMSSELFFDNDILMGIKENKEVQMVGLFFEETLVSAMLVLTKENSAGLYFIVTRKDYQKRGFATILIHFILNRMHENHVKKVVLHANHYSFGLYRKLGFVSQNKFVIYKINRT